MKVILISYANKPFYKSQQELKKSALKYGVDEVIDYNDIWLKKQTVFYQKNKHILSQKRGNGYWLWKPLIILDAFQKMNQGDVLIYLDTGCTIVHDVAPLIALTQQHEMICFYNNSHTNDMWTKRDCFYFMDADNNTYHKGVQVAASYLVLRKTNAVIDIVKEWLHYAGNATIITDAPNVCGLSNLSNFKDHRHDQSILSILAIKHKLSLFRDPSQWGNKYKMEEYRVQDEFVEDGYVTTPFLNAPYPTIIDGHRKKLPLTLKDRWMLYLKRYKIFDSK